MKKLLIIGTGSGQVMMIKKAKQLGVRVIGVDRDSCSMGASLCDSFFEIDTMNKKAVLELACRCKVDGITTCATNLAIHTVSYVGERLKLKTIPYESAKSSTDKIAWKSILKRNNIPIIEGISHTNKKNAKILAKKIISLPWVLKPSDGSGCKGISIVRKIKDFDKAFDKALLFSRNNRVLTETFLEGQVIGVESLVINGKTKTLMITDKKMSRSFSFITIGLNMPADIKDELKHIIHDLVEKVNFCLGINMGPTHIDIIINKGIPRVIDIGPRLAGGPLVYELIPKITGINYMELVIKQALGYTICMPSIKNKCFGASRFFTSKNTGTIENIVFPKCFPKSSKYLYKDIGDRCFLAEHNVDRIGCVTMFGRRYSDTVFQIDNFVKKVKIIVA
jgi:biotin carboxylase